MAVHQGDPRISLLQLSHFPTKHHHPYYRMDDAEKPATKVRIGVQWKRWYDPELGCWRQDAPGPAERGQILGRLFAGSSGQRLSRGRGSVQEQKDRVTTPTMGGSWVGWRHEGASADDLRARANGR